MEEKVLVWICNMQGVLLLMVPCIAAGKFWCLDPWKKVRGSDGRMELASKCVALEVARPFW